MGAYLRAAIGTFLSTAIGAALLVYADQWVVTSWPFWTLGAMGLCAGLARQTEAAP